MVDHPGPPVLVAPHLGADVAGRHRRRKFLACQNWRPWTVDPPTVEAAWAIEARYQLGFWDALIIASAQQQGCDSLLTDALPHGQQIDGVHILNPFTVGPETLALPAP